MKPGLHARNLARSIWQRVPPALRYGAAYREWRALLERHRHADAEAARAWQLESLRDLLRRAGEESVYYRELFRSTGFSWRDVRAVGDLAALPLLDRPTVTERRDDLLSNRFRKDRLHFGTTGGTTGTPLGIYFSKEHYAGAEAAFVDHIWGRYGYRHGRRQAFFRGVRLKEGPVERTGRSLFLSSFHTTEENLREYVRSIREFRPAYLQAFPSSLYALCRFMEENDLPPFDSLELVLVSSENLPPSQSRLASARLGVPVCNLYGNTERSVMGATLPGCDLIHLYPEYGVAEVVPPAGEPGGATGEIVSTGFTNPAFFLIRYRTGDLGTVSAGGCPCGWRHTVLECIEGRSQDFLVGYGGRKLYGAPLNPHSDTFDRVSRFQFQQEQAGEVVLKVVPRSGFDDAERERIRAATAELLGADFQLTVEAVAEIPLSARGKHTVIRQGMGNP